MGGRKYPSLAILAPHWGFLENLRVEDPSCWIDHLLDRCPLEAGELVPALMSRSLAGKGVVRITA